MIPFYDKIKSFFFIPHITKNVKDIMFPTSRLAFPVAPPEPVNDKKRMVAILPYTKMPDTDEITFQKGLFLFEYGLNLNPDKEILTSRCRTQMKLHSRKFCSSSNTV